MKPSRETFAGRRRAPDLFGLERAALYPMAGAWTGAAVLVTVGHVRFGLPWPLSFLFAVGPALVVTAASLLLIQGKPPGYLTDWAEEHLLAQKNADFWKDRPPPHAPFPRT